MHAGVRLRLSLVCLLFRFHANRVPTFAFLYRMLYKICLEKQRNTNPPQGNWMNAVNV